MAARSLGRLVEKGAGLLQKGRAVEGRGGGADIHIHGASDTMTNLPKQSGSQLTAASPNRKLRMIDTTRVEIDIMLPA